MRRLTGLLGFALLIAATAGARAQDMHMQDTRTLVRLPQHMQQHMLANMRDHLVTLDAILGNVADGKYDAAAKLAEARLGMSSLSLHGAAQMAPFMPQPMQAMGTEWHHAASRLVIVLQNASLTQDAAAMRKVAGALHAVTSACTGCHAAYRIR